MNREGLAGDIMAALRQAMGKLPADPIRPECRGVSKLVPSGYVPRGVFYRVAPQPELEQLLGHLQPLVVMNSEDVASLRQVFAEMTFPPADLDQEIADCAEQVFQDSRRARMA